MRSRQPPCAALARLRQTLCCPPSIISGMSMKPISRKSGVPLGIAGLCFPIRSILKSAKAAAFAPVTALLMPSPAPWASRTVSIPPSASSAELVRAPVSSAQSPNPNKPFLKKVWQMPGLFLCLPRYPCAGANRNSMWVQA